MDKMKKEDMEKVQGGLDNHTIMKCSACGFTTNWAGKYDNCSYDCPICKAKNTFTGTDYFPGYIPLIHVIV